jgi:hypothetical protein
LPLPAASPQCCAERLRLSDNPSKIPGGYASLFQIYFKWFTLVRTAFPKPCARIQIFFRVFDESFCDGIPVNIADLLHQNGFGFYLKRIRVVFPERMFFEMNSMGVRSKPSLDRILIEH